MRVIAGAGTPHELETKVCKDSAMVKRFLIGRIEARIKWASAYNLRLHAELSEIRKEIDDYPVNALKVGEQRQWSAVDEVTGVAFVFDMVKEAS